MLNSHADVDHFGGNAAIRAAAPRALVLRARGRRCRGSRSRALILRERYGWYDGLRHRLPARDVRVAARRHGAGHARRRRGCAAASASGSGPSSRWTCCTCPGHSPGHLGLWEPRSRTAIVMDAVMARGLLDMDGNVIHPPPYFDVAGYERSARLLLDARARAAPDGALRRDRGRRRRALPRGHDRVRRARRAVVARRSPRAGELPLGRAPRARATPSSARSPRCRTSSPRRSRALRSLRRATRRARHGTSNDPRRTSMELGMISSTWLGTKVGRLEGIRQAKADRVRHVRRLRGPARPDRRRARGDQGDAARRSACRSARSSASPSGSSTSTRRCSASRSTASRRTSTRAPTSAPATSCSSSASTTGTARCSRARRSGTWRRRWSRRPASTRGSKGLEIVLELEPFTEALLKDVDELVRFVTGDRPPGRSRERRHLAPPPLGRVLRRTSKKLTGLIGHIHLSDCDGKVHGDLPAGMGVTPIKDYLAAIRDTGYDGTVSIELEYSPDPDKIVEWAQQAYDGTAAIMRELGVRGLRGPDGGRSTSTPARTCRRRPTTASAASAPASS